MHRIALRTAARPAARSLRTATTKRFASTASPADRPRSWKSSALRWGLAGAALYYYNTSTVFADEMPSRTVDAPPTFADDDLPTVDSVIEQKRKQVQSKIETQLAKQPEKSSPAEPTKADALSTTPEAKGNEASPAVAVEGGAGALQEEADQQGAFNPETGEINWDCPCLGGMAHGPCGEEFKTAFSCFVYSNEEPKGMDCIEKFQYVT
jgi:intermembrane space import and assembly protein 40